LVVRPAASRRALREFKSLMPGSPNLTGRPPHQLDFMTTQRPADIITDLQDSGDIETASECIALWLTKTLPPKAVPRAAETHKTAPDPPLSRAQRRSASRFNSLASHPKYVCQDEVGPKQTGKQLKFYRRHHDLFEDSVPPTVSIQPADSQVSPMSSDSDSLGYTARPSRAGTPVDSDASASEPEEDCTAAPVPPPVVPGTPNSQLPFEPCNTAEATPLPLEVPPTAASALENSFLENLRHLFADNGCGFSGGYDTSPALKIVHKVLTSMSDVELLPYLPALARSMKDLLAHDDSLCHFDYTTNYLKRKSDMHRAGQILLKGKALQVEQILFDSGAIGANYMSKRFFEENIEELMPFATASNKQVRLGDSMTTCGVSFEVMLTVECKDAGGFSYTGRSSFLVFDTHQDLIVGLPLIRQTDLGILFTLMIAEARELEAQRALPPPGKYKVDRTRFPHRDFELEKAELPPSLLAYRNDCHALEFGERGMRDCRGTNMYGAWDECLPPELSLLGESLDLRQPWSVIYEPAPEEFHDELPSSFAYALHFMEMSVEDAAREFFAQVDAPGHVSQPFRDNTDVIELLKTKGLPVFVPQNWEGINGLPLLKLKFKDGIPSRMRPPPRRVNPLLWVNAKKEYDRLLTYFYVPSNSEIASCLVIAPKATAPFLRMCGDYVRLNKYIEMGHFPIPHVQQELAKLQKFKIFLDLDWTNSFHQIKLHPETSRMLSIVTPWGQVEPLFLPEGVGPASAELQKVVAEIFADFSDWTVAIFDNLLVLANDWDDAYRKLEMVLDRCKERNLFLKFSKTFLGYPTVTFFGYECKEHSYGLSQQRKDEINKIPFPSSNTAAASFLGASLFFHSHIPNYSGLTAHLYTMTSKSFSWDRSTWKRDYEEDFALLKAAILKSFECFYPDYNLDWILRTDASTTGVGAVLLQRLADGTLQPIIFISEKFSGPASRWSTIKQEAYAIKWAVDKLAYYLHCKFFVIETDHQNLVWIEQSTVPIIQRWRIALQSFNFLLRHIPGKHNSTADWLSRLFNLDQVTGLNCATRKADADSEINLFARLFRLEDLDARKTLFASDSPFTEEQIVSSVYSLSAITLLNIAMVMGDSHDLSTLTPALLPARQRPADETPTAPALFARIHNGRMAHHGAKRSFALMNEYFPGHGISFEVIEELVRSCPICQKHRIGVPKGEIKEIVKSFLPEHQRSILGVDIVKVTPDKNGNIYCIIPVNLLTKHCEIYPAKDKEAITLATAIFSYVTTFGLFDQLRSDPGSDLTSEVVAHLNKWIGWRHTFTLVGRPQGSGVERTNGKFLDLLIALVMEERVKDNWSHPSVLNVIKYILNCTPNSETGVIPLHATFGAPAETYLKLTANLSPTDRVHQYVRLLNDNLAALNAVTKVKQAEIHEKRTKETPLLEQNMYQKGDYVLRFTAHPLDKMTPRWRGPYIVTSQVANTVTARDLLSHAVIPGLQVAKLKRFVGSPADAFKMAQLDNDQFEVSSILAYRGDPDVRSTVQFLVKFSDSTTHWLTYTKDLFDTIQYEDFCSSLPQLRQMKYGALDALKYRRKLKSEPIKLVAPGDVTYVDLRSWGATWYSTLDIPDRDTNTYVVRCVYGDFRNKSNTRINAKFGVLDESYAADNLFVTDYGSSKIISPGHILVDAKFMEQYGHVIRDPKRNKVLPLHTLLSLSHDPTGVHDLSYIDDRADSMALVPQPNNNTPTFLSIKFKK